MQTLNITKKYETYPAYKDSGVEWLGKIPKNWDLASTRRLFATSKNPLGETASDYKVLSLTLRGVIPRVLDGSGKNPADYATYQMFNKDDLAFCLFDYDVTPRTIGYVEEDGMMTGAYTRLIPKRETYSKYFYYYFLSLDYTKELLHLCTGLRNSIPKPIFWSMKSPLPGLEEQAKIATYLDEKTALIDQIVEKKQKLIDLLREKRTAVINHAVTKGLDPSVELVDSGVEWIGKIPKGWELEKLKRISRMNKMTLSEDTDPDFSFKYFDIGSVDEEQTSNTHEEITFAKAPSRARRVVSSGDSIIATVRTYLKAIAFFDTVVSNTIASTGFAVLSPKPKLVPKYLYYYLQSDRFINQVILNSKGIGYPAITPSGLGSLEVLSPAKKLQEEIVGYLDEKISAYNSVIQKAERSVEALQEFKSSLISHVVTGKIKI